MTFWLIVASIFLLMTGHPWLSAICIAIALFG